jgi:HTH-type transcriptional regulator/antitoxin HigA
MDKLAKERYEFALARVEELLPLVDDATPANDKKALELSVMSDIVIAYEKEHFPIEPPSVAELIALALEEKGITQKELAGNIGVSPSRINDYITGRAQPTLKIARLLCLELNIKPAAMLRVQADEMVATPRHSTFRP